MMLVGIWMLTPSPLSGLGTKFVVHSDSIVMLGARTAASAVVNVGGTAPRTSVASVAAWPVARCSSAAMMLSVVVSTSVAWPPLPGTTAISPPLNAKDALIGAMSLVNA